MLEYLTPLISSYVSIYLPIEIDMGTRIACSMAITQLFIGICELIKKYIYPKLIKLLNWSNNIYIIIKYNNPIYETLLEYFYNKHKTELKGCYVHVEYGKHKMFINELINKHLEETFELQKIYISFMEESTTQKDLPEQNKRNICMKSKNMKILDNYISHIILKIHNYKSESSNKLKIYKLYSEGKKDNHVLHWQFNEHITTKNIKNTIVSDNVNKLLFEDIKYFIENEKYYKDHGIPYRRGYLLHGEPGTGKTSLIKVIANLYNIPIFIVDYDTFHNNDEFISTMDKINAYIMNERHIIVFEDIDRSNLCSRFGYEKSISTHCFLNFLDGVDENYGRITFITTNDLKTLEEIPALLRPGRIDRVIYVSFCTQTQITEILKLYYNEIENKIEDDIIITPAVLIQIIMYVNDITKIVEILNTKKNFINYKLEKLDEIVCMKEQEQDKIEGNKNEVKELSYRDRVIKQNENKLKRSEIKLNLLEKKIEELKGKDDLIASKYKIAHDKLKLDIELNKIKLKNLLMNIDYRNAMEELPITTRKYRRRR